MKKIFCIISVMLLIFSGCGKTGGNVAQEQTFELPYARNSGPVKCYIDQNGELFTWGFDVYLNGTDSIANYSSLGQGDAMIYNNIPTKIYSNMEYVIMTSGVTKNGEMLQWGFRADKKATVPEVVRQGISMMNGTFYLTSSGELFTYRLIDEMDSSDKNYRTGDVSIDTDVVDIAGSFLGTGIGNGGTIALKKDATIWSYQLDSNLHLKKKRQVTKNVTRIFKGTKSSGTVFLLKEDGSLWSFGNNEFGQCGNGEHGDLDKGSVDCVVSEPFKVLDHVRNVYYSQWQAVYAVTENGDLYGWGCNDSDLFLQGGEKTIYSDQTHSVHTTPVFIMSGVKEVVYSGNFNTVCLVIKEDDSLWAWGTNICGELGNGTLPKTEDLGLVALTEKLRSGNAEFFKPVKILDGVKRYVGSHEYLQFIEMLDGRVMYWGLDYILADEDDDWDTKISSWSDQLFQKHYIIPTPIDFSVETYFQTALEYIAAQSGADISQYQAARYIEK